MKAVLIKVKYEDSQHFYNFWVTEIDMKISQQSYIENLSNWYLAVDQWIYFALNTEIFSYILWKIKRLFGFVDLLQIYFLINSIMINPEYREKYAKHMITTALSNFRYVPTAIIMMGDMREFLNCTNIFPECLA